MSWTKTQNRNTLKATPSHSVTGEAGLGSCSVSRVIQLTEDADPTLRRSPNVKTEHQELLTCTMSLSASFPREEILMSSPSSSTMAAEKQTKKHFTFFAFDQSRMTSVVLILTVELCLADSNDDDRHGKFCRLQEKSNLSNGTLLKKVDKKAEFKLWKSNQTRSAGQGLSHTDICIWVVIAASGGTGEISHELKQILHSNPWESRYGFHTVLWGAAGAVWGPRRDLHEMHDSAQGPRGDYRPRQSDGCESCNMFSILTRHRGFTARS